MATLLSGGTSVKVEKGDTLETIARDYKSQSGNKTVQQLAALNNITGPKYYISVGQTIKLKASSSSESTSSKTTSNKATITHFGLQSDADVRTLFATWSWTKESTEEYKVMWSYTTGAGVWFIGNESTTKHKQSVYTAPESAKKVKFKVQPVAKKETKNNKQVAKWTADWSTEKIYDFANTPPQTPSGLQAEINGYKLTASLSEQSNLYATSIEFQVWKDSNNKRSKFTSGTAKLDSLGFASYTCTVSAGPSYLVRCRSVDGKETSEWSELVVAGGTIAPAAVKEITELKVISDTEIKVDWNGIPNATSETVYEVQYTTEKRWFDSSDGNVTIVNIDAKPDGVHVAHTEITGLQTGEEYFFRVRAKNGAAGPASAWTKIKSVILGKAPDAPTTWSNTTTSVVGDNIYLYWMHNSEDGSSQTWAQVDMIINGTTTTYTVKNPVQTTAPNGSAYETTIINGTTYVKIGRLWVAKLSEENKDQTTSCIFKTDDYEEGVDIKWRVKTAGILTKSNGDPEYGPYSTTRTITVNAYPTLSLDILRKNVNYIESIDDEFIDSLEPINDDLVERFPFYISGEVDYSPHQRPIGYHVSIASMEKYWTVDAIGNEIMVNEGQELYSSYFNTDTDLLLEMTPANIDLQNNMSYKVTCIVSMSSGLTATATYDFSVRWTEERYVTNAEISIDRDSLTANIRPYCERENIIYKVVYHEPTTDVYIATQVESIAPTGIPLEGVTTTDGKQVFLSIRHNDITGEDDEIYYYEDYVVGNVVYRLVSRDPASGTYSELQTILTAPTGVPLPGITTTNGKQVFMTSQYNDEPTDDDVVYYYEDIDPSVLPDVTLAVYRREYDGRFVEIQNGMTGMETATDPHPSLDFARYRIVSTANKTGAVYFYDVPGVPVEEKSIVIQWDEQWSNFDSTDNPDALEQPPWAGSMLKLPYNIDISTDYDNDLSLVSYIGRRSPVSYYGTIHNETATWKVDIDSTDVDTLYAIRRLASWMGDVYVREPSGSGYWANISVSFSQTHLELTIPVTFKITRVEGGL